MAGSNEFRMMPGWEDQVVNAMRPEMKVRMDIAEGSSRGRVPVDTGHLMSTIHSEVDAEGSGVLGATASYARYVERGTRYMQGYHFLEEGMEDAF